MKQLLLIRHAKSSWENFSVQDFDRPLNERGKKDAPAMAQRLLEKNIKIDAFISSPAKRARKTAEAFAKAYHRNTGDIIFYEFLYLASPAVLARIISETDNRYHCIAVFSHNDGLTDFANQLTTARIDNIPTCGIFAVNIRADNWKDFAAAEKTYWFFDCPKAGISD